jgi:hypothetical protein
MTSMTLCSCRGEHLLELLWPKKADNFYCNCPTQTKESFKVLQSLGAKAIKKVILPAIAFPALFAAGPNLSQVDGL